MTQRLEAIGINLDKRKWDDGFDHDDVTKIYVLGGINNITYIYFDYVKRGKLEEGSGHGYLNDVSFTVTFEIDHLKNEYLESVEGYYSESNGIQALQFKTNLKTSQVMGYVKGGTKFSLAVEGKKIIGFHGSGNSSLFSLGAYFSLIVATKVKSKGGKGGKEWDDGSNHDNLSKIQVRGGSEGIQFIRFDYVKNGQVINGSIHGVSRRGFTQLFEIDHLNNEYLVSVEGYYDNASGVIQGLQFKTNLKTFDMIGYDKGIKFSLADNGNKIIGFHGYSETSLNSLGVYFTTHTSNKLDLQGLRRGYFWDDGSSNQGIRKVYAEVPGYVTYIRFEFDNGGKVEKTLRRGNVEYEKEFALDYPNEFITSVEGTIKNSRGAPFCITALTFKTSKGRTSPTFGSEEHDSKFVLEKKGNALVGLYGYCAGTLNAIGAYYRPLPPPPNANKLEAKGGDGGAPWDDGDFEGVRNIYIGLSQNAVAFIKFMYYKDAEMVFGDDHGNKTGLYDVKEFALNFPVEYLTSVEANYDDKSGAITMLRFKTNNQTSPNFGTITVLSVLHVHHKEDHKIVGFHGKSSNMLHQLGVHVKPI